MKFIHLSDTHLGFSDYYKIDPQTGINQREQDFYRAWFHIIDKILEIKPDFVIHAGDLFHTSRPTNRAIAVALEGIQKISDAGIILVTISGNHSTPKIRATGSIFESIALLPNVFASFQGKYDKFKIGNCEIHCIPHCSLTEELEKAFNSIHFSKNMRYHILVTHGAWAGNKSFSMGEFNEQFIPDPETKMNLSLDYIALGHYHKHIKIKPHIIYSGSTERTSFNEADNPTGFMIVDLETGDRKYHTTPSRPMVRLDPLDCSELNTSQIYTELEHLSTPDLKDALVSVQLLNVRHETLIKLENREIDDIFPEVFYLNKIITQFARDDQKISGSIQLGALPLEFEKYIEKIDHSELDKDQLRSLGLTYLTREL